MLGVSKQNTVAFVVIDGVLHHFHVMALHQRKSRRIVNGCVLSQDVVVGVHVMHTIAQMVHGILFNSVILTRNNIHTITCFTDFIIENMTIGHVSNLNTIPSVSRS